MMKIINREISDKVNLTRDGDNSLSSDRIQVARDRLLDAPYSTTCLGYLPIALAKPKIVVGRRK